jgi:hypothetical protein
MDQCNPAQYPPGNGNLFGIAMGRMGTAYLCRTT